MNAILHILRKDLRHHWREVALFVFSSAAWAWQITHPWNWVFLRDREIVPILLFGSWFLVTIRVVHGESLLGDREFWMTRPYRWPQLMAAKALFLLLCLNGPLFLAEVALLVHAHLPVTAFTLAGLLVLQLEFAVLLTFPAAVLAAVTATLVQWILTVLGLFLFALMLSWLPWNLLPVALAGQENVASYLGAAIVIPALAFALVWQYARRRVWIASAAILLAVFTVPLMILVAHTANLHSLAYTLRPADQVPMRFEMKDQAGANTYFHGIANDELGAISLPLAATFADADTILSVDGYRISLAGDNNWRWQSPWINRALKLNSGDPRASLSFALPLNLANQLPLLHPNATVELAYSLYHLDPARRISTGADTFTLPGGISCRWPRERSLYFRNASECAAPLRLPEVIVERIDSADVNCLPDPGEPPLPTNHSAFYAHYGNDNWFPEFDPDPVRGLPQDFYDWNPPLPSALNPKETRHISFCRGTPLTIRTGTSTGPFQSTFNLGPLGQERRGAINPNPPDRID